MELSNHQRLSLAARRGNVDEVLELLGTEGVDINWIPEDDELDWRLKPALFEAISTNNYNIAKLLLDNGADPNISFQNGDNWSEFRPLSLTYYHALDEFIILLCQYDVDLEFEWSYVLSAGSAKATVTKSVWSAGATYKPEVLNALLEHELKMVIKGKKTIDARSHIDNYSILDRIVLFGEPMQIEAAIQLGADPNVFYYHCRVSGGGNKIEVVYPPVVNLCKYSNSFSPEKLDTLIKNGADINASIIIDNLKCKALERTKRTALWYACKEADSNIIEHLLRHGADPTLADASGRTPLMLLQKKRESHLASEAILRALVNRGIRLENHLELKSRKGLTALDYSMQKHDHKMIKTLLLLGTPFEYRASSKIPVPIMSLTAIWARECRKHVKAILNFIMKTQRLGGDYLPNELVRLIITQFLSLIINGDENVSRQAALGYLKSHKWIMRWFKELFGTCMEGRQGDKMDWIEIEYRKLCQEREVHKADKISEDEFVDLTLSTSPHASVVGSPIPTVCSPVSSLYLVIDKDQVALYKRPKALLPPIVPTTEPDHQVSVKDRVKVYEQSLSSKTLTRPVSPAVVLEESQTKAIREQYKKPKNVEDELRRYQAMKRMQKYDQRARQETARKSPMCPGLGGSGRYRSPTYPPSHILTSPYRSLQ